MPLLLLLLLLHRLSRRLPHPALALPATITRAAALLS